MTVRVYGVPDRHRVAAMTVNGLGTTRCGVRFIAGRLPVGTPAQTARCPGCWVAF